MGTIYVDLDRTLADAPSESWKKGIAEPLPGAREFMSSLREFDHRVVIYSCRTSSEVAGPDESRRQKKMIEDWLRLHEIPADGVYDGPGKPDGEAFIDDKGVSCRPQVQGREAYGEALLALGSMLT